MATNNLDGSLDNKAYIYRDSPFILGGPGVSPTNPNIGAYLDRRNPEVITTNNALTAGCAINFMFSWWVFQDQLDECIRVLGDRTQAQTLPRNSDRTWIFPVGTPEFYQVQSMYHLQLAKQTFLSKLEFAYQTVHSSNPNAPKSVPSYLRSSKMFWFKGVSNTNSQTDRNSYLTSYATCNLDRNASFSPAGPELCFGNSSTNPGFQVVQDPSVIYHEFGHAIVSILMNLRNGVTAANNPSLNHPFRSSLGYSLGYDEGGALNEGIADYFSFVINRRPHIGEWLGRVSRQSRPLTEDDRLHIPVLSTSSADGRLSYPNYVLYDPNQPDKQFENVHYAGQIVSHYLHALTEDLKRECALSGDGDGGHGRSTSYVMLLLAETLSEMGDLNAFGVDNPNTMSPIVGQIFFNNLNRSSSFLWAHHVNAPSFRRFFQIFAKNMNRYLAGNLCSGLYTKNKAEQLLDAYGLLLFRTYNDNGNSTTERTVEYRHIAGSGISAQPLTPVQENNRRKSTLVSKQQLSLQVRTNEPDSAASFYLIDNKTDIQNILNVLLFKGLPVPLSTNVTSTDYNNNNVRISPGEIVAVIPNLYNASNTTMAGVQLLATDWDHTDLNDTATGKDTVNGFFRPCVVDEVTTVDQGAVADRTCSGPSYPDKDYRRMVRICADGTLNCPASQRRFPEQAAAPVCLVQLEEGNSTRWVSQSEFRGRNGLSLQDKECLGFSTSGVTDPDFNFNPHECLVRFLPRMNTSHYSKIDPRKSYFDSVVRVSEDKVFNFGNVLMMEVSKWVPPGTKFRCRLRARFSNCSDCYTEGAAVNNDDYLDYEYNGHRPFKVINLDFEVND